MLKHLVRIVLLTWAVMKAISWKLWIADRTFPLVPVVPYPAAVHIALALLFVLLVILLLIKPLHPLLLSLLLISELIALLGDQLRWQPWEYQFLCLLFATFINRKNEQRALNTIIFILAATYFYSGVQKWNGSFLSNVWARMILIRFLHLPLSFTRHVIVLYAGLLIPALEALCGAGLLFRPYRRWSAAFLIVMHLHDFSVVRSRWDFTTIW